MAQTPEGKVKAKITKALRELGVWYFFPANNGLGRGGIPDIICIVSGWFIGVEVKAGKNRKPTPLQVKCGQEIIEAGGHWYLVYDDETTANLISHIKELLQR